MYLSGNLCGLPLCQQQICMNEEIDAYLCTNSRLSCELRLYGIYADVFSILINELKAESVNLLCTPN